MVAEFQDSVNNSLFRTERNVSHNGSASVLRLNILEEPTKLELSEFVNLNY
jgi:hypothetical protein